METITKKLISQKISQKINSGEISFGIKKKITDFILTSFHRKNDLVENGNVKNIVFCTCEFTEGNSVYSKAFEISI